MCRCNFIQKLETCYASIPHKILKTSFWAHFGEFFWESFSQKINLFSLRLHVAVTSFKQSEKLHTLT